MSLINDALKKAQKQRDGETPPLAAMPGIGGEPAVRIAKRSKPIGFNSMMMWIGLGAGTLCVLIVVGFFLVRWLVNRPSTPAPTPVPVAIVAAKTPPPATKTEPVPAPPAATISSPTFSIPSTPVVVAPPPVAPPPPVEVKPVAVAPVTPAPEVLAPKEYAPLKLAPKAIAYIEGLRVAGIRASSTDSKVLMNDRVYREGDTIEHNFGLKLAVISPNSLTFEDERGARYTRNF